MDLSAVEIEKFQAVIWHYYAENERKFPWRETTNPYEIWVSEIMLQQTQTSRVVPKYLNFLSVFPTVLSLTNASGGQLLTAWQGLGYNRRALSLQKSAQIVVENFSGQVPTTIEDLQSLPGIGYATACSISAFAFNLPVVFIETNIRRVYLHYFFPNHETPVHDKELLPLIEQTLPKDRPRLWYYALMDYGAYLPKTVTNPNRRSQHYTKQSQFAGSNRQLRGMIIRVLTEKERSLAWLIEEADGQAERVAVVVNDLQKEGFVCFNPEDGSVSLA